jgi:UDP-xylose/UDP-N-acetylglucosamine transporter B4
MGQFLSVVLVTLGIVMNTLASTPSSKTTMTDEPPLSIFMVGLGLLVASLLFTGGLGVLQDYVYEKFGKHWNECMFYAVCTPSRPIFFGTNGRYWAFLTEMILPS